MENRLNIIDEKENIIGEDTRENIHSQGLLHREVWVWFYNSKGEIIFQYRGKNKDTFANLLDATVNGHVELGESYEDAVIRETKEETDISISLDSIKSTEKIRGEFYDPIINKTNNIIRAVYIYKYDGEIKDLKVEVGEGLGFEIYPIEKIFNISDEQKKKFVPQIFDEKSLEVFREIKELI
ncbi:NUDIX domain-containing protein [Patescibacteria group bacterium]|nr:NUDIX domain-containing protein [Patescibacteria group bacterium]